MNTRDLTWTEKALVLLSGTTLRANAGSDLETLRMLRRIAALVEMATFDADEKASDLVAKLFEVHCRSRGLDFSAVDVGELESLGEDPS